MKKNYLCIHGHFYQPPRENPWLNTIAIQASASPYHDWNDRINRDCYLPNVYARVLDNKGLIRNIINNYKYISFNFGPTLLSWLEKHAPDTYSGIMEADRYSLNKLGHGNAIAQVYNHIIMPLATYRDKEIQIKWGIKDFEYRFNREPEGMWLAETAVDVETLELLCENNIKFTILAPGQASAYREADSDWIDTQNGEGIDPSRPYRCVLPSGNTISIFFYDGPLSHAIAFEKLLANGEHFFNRITQSFNGDRDWPQLVNLATDGESYGHHFFHGEMALAYCLNLIDENDEIEIINYATYLEKFPHQTEVKILENTAWSCSHGVGRWEKNCGCNTGGNNGWNQEWRGPLRESFDLLREETDHYLETEGHDIFVSVESAVDNYIGQIINNGRTESKAEFIENNFKPRLSDEHIHTGLLLLEMKYMSLLSYTSCAWFFDDISGIEPVQILKYAARLIDLGYVIDLPLSENKFLEILAKAQSNDPKFGSGSDIFNKIVMPEKFSLRKISAHFAVHKLLWPKFADDKIHFYPLELEFHKKSSFNQLTLAGGRVIIQCPVTLEKFPFEYIALHLSGLDINVFSRYGNRGEAYHKVLDEAFEIFEEKSLTDLIRFLPDYFGENYFTISDMFIDDRHQIVEYVNQGSMIRLGRMVRDFFAENKKLFLQLSNAKYPLPPAYKMIIEYTMDHDLNKNLSKLVDDDLQNEAEVAFNIVEQIILMKQTGLEPSESQVNNTFIPYMKKILEKVVDYEISPQNFYSILKELNELAPLIDWWPLQDRLLDYLKRDPDPNLIVDSDFVEICDFLKIRVADFD